MVEWFTTVFEIIGTIAFAVSGALAAIESRLDLLGVVVLGVTTAVGGGVIRDVVLGNTPPQAFVHPVYGMIAIITSLLVFVFKKYSHSGKTNTWFTLSLFLMDTLGLAVFTVVGITAAHKTEAGLSLLVFVGVITGVGGGVLRDIMRGRQPMIFVKHFYCTAAIVGAIITALLIRRIDETQAMLLGALVIIALRIAAAHYRWELPKIEEQ